MSQFLISSYNFFDICFNTYIKPFICGCNKLRNESYILSIDRGIKKGIKSASMHVNLFEFNFTPIYFKLLIQYIIIKFFCSVDAEIAIQLEQMLNHLHKKYQM